MDSQFAFGLTGVIAGLLAIVVGALFTKGFKIAFYIGFLIFFIGVLFLILSILKIGVV